LLSPQRLSATARKIQIRCLGKENDSHLRSMIMNFVACRAAFHGRTGIAGRHYNVIDSCKEISSQGGADCLPAMTENDLSVLLPVFPSC